MIRFFIDRPVFATVVSVVILLLGLVCMVLLPIAQFPQVAPPVVTIEANYPGATAETVAESVAAPIEKELSGAKGLMYYQSQSGNDGRMVLTVTFEIGTDLDLNAVEVQNRVRRAEARLPDEVKRQGLTVTKKSTDMLMLVNLRSEDSRFDDLYLANYAGINLVDALKRVPGVGDAMVYGAGEYAMRIWLRPDLLARQGLSVSDVASAVREQNGAYAAGRIGARPNPSGPELTVPAVAPGRLTDAKEFADIVLRAETDGSLVRVRDIADVELGAQSYDQFARLNGQPTTLIPIYLQPGANALETARKVRAEMGRLAAAFPAGVSYTVPYDTTKFVEVSVDEVKKTFIEATLLVLLVVFVFLQSFRATVVPLLAVPISVIGAFVGMQALGFSINSLTLFGLVLAIGMVVDDAILVVENVERVLKEDAALSVRDAVIKAMGEVTGPIVAATLVNACVFLPVSFLGGLTGVMYRQFAVTIAISVLISGVVALVFCPALCAILLRRNKSDHSPRRWSPFGLFNRGFEMASNAYASVVRGSIRFSIVTILAYGAILLLGDRMMAKVPGGFVPDEDQGAFMVAMIMPDGASLDRTEAFAAEVSSYFRTLPEVEDVVVMGGLNVFANANSTDAGLAYVTLKDWSLRKSRGQHALDLIARVNRELGKKKEGLAFAFNPPAITGLGTRAGFEFQIQNRSGGDVRDLADITRTFLGELRQRPEVVGATVPLSVSLPQMSVDVDRTRTAVTGVSIADVFSTLQAMWGSLYINDFTADGRVWRVQLQAAPEYRSRPQDLTNLFVRNRQGDRVPLSGLVKTTFKAGPNVVSRFNGFTSVQLTGAPAAGFSSGQAMAALQDVAAKTLPEGFGYEFSGASLQEVRAGNQAPLVIGLGLAMVFLILAAQFERWLLPASVLLAVPVGLAGAYAAVLWRGLNADIFFQIGLLTLVGLAAKNAILIVEFCVVQRRSGRSMADAAVEAARQRFRPILMTSFTFILGCVPLALSSGAGAGARNSIGTGVIGGMLAGTLLLVVFVPLFYVVVQGLSERLYRSKK